MLIKKNFTVLILAVLLLVPVINAQSPQAVPKTVPTKLAVDTQPVEVRSAFKEGVIKNIQAAVKSGLIKRGEAVKLRMAMLSPAFEKRAEDLAVLQMAASGEDGPFEVSDTGEIIRETINWEGLALFLEKIMPLLLKLLAGFGI